MDLCQRCQQVNQPIGTNFVSWLDSQLYHQRLFCHGQDSSAPFPPEETLWVRVQRVPDRRSCGLSLVGGERRFDAVMPKWGIHIAYYPCRYGLEKFHYGFRFCFCEVRLVGLQVGEELGEIHAVFSQTVPAMLLRSAICIRNHPGPGVFNMGYRGDKCIDARLCSIERAVLEKRFPIRKEGTVFVLCQSRF